MAESDQMTVIGSDTYIKGEMTFERTARIVGKFDGKIQAKGELQIAEGATCNAEVSAANINVDGSVEGNLNAGEKVAVNAKARVKGDIVANRLTVAEGASLNGHVSIGPDASKKGGAGSPPPVPPQAKDDPRGKPQGK